ncbi:site-specific DNA-methyltransferase [Phycicoccus sp. Soil803]|uniref:site-specific DNA-methyltransferase n=1 Tax=Phycicoccus sp. Soil803 TaxID=1736415 RepID=UPI00070E9E68|nr:DNA methyltransferase [Phycicoccus sp. Soil803]KRF23792.1 DNA methyltransferase [Phycicoccus sp. Soil803]
MSRLSDLLRQLRSENVLLADEIDREVAALADRRAFGLNFERHVPEAVELPGRRVRKGDKVRVLPPRGQTPTTGSEKLWQVMSIDRISGTAALEALGRDVSRQVTLEELVVVAEFRDPIYPGLSSTGKVERGGDKPFHAVINAENYHALQTLLFTHRGRVDCIYIDPPYNTGAKDWKYNNDYVEGDDLYRHSKWLAFMERRLLLAKELLNPEDSVLIVAIDEKEYLRLGLLLEQTFPESKIQMITTVIKPGGTSRTKEFSRVEEYLYFVFIGESELVRSADSMLSGIAAGESTSRGLAESDLWEGMIRRGIGVVRAQREGQFYPIFIDADRGAIVSAGEPVGRGVDRRTVIAPSGLTPVWPIKDDMTEGFWQLNPGGLAKARVRGTVRVGSFNAKTGQWRIQYMKAKKAKAVEDGLVATLGKDENGVVILDLESSQLSALSTPRTVWNKTSHDASTGGAGLLNRLLPQRKFPFAKSLFAVEDAIRFFVSNKPEAVIVDFFAGSGTTTHAVMRLNRQDGGRRASIVVTNNEVSAAEQITLRAKGLRPGDPEWEAKGICDLITKPRIQAAVTGLTPSGELIKGDYRSPDEFPIADGLLENVEFFTLTYEAPLRVASNREFLKIAPLLWIRAGSTGRRIDDISSGWDVADKYGVLADLDHTEAFLKAVVANHAVAVAYIVTDEDRLFESVAQELPDHVEPVRLYEAYLRNFEIESGRGSL